MQFSRFSLIFSLLLIASIINISYSSRIYRSNEICGVFNAHRVYLEAFDKGYLQATNVTVQEYQIEPNLSKSEENESQIMASPLNYCSLEIVTCPSCRIRISITFANFTTQCHEELLDEASCPCEYLFISEPPYEQNISGKKLCGKDLIYLSATRSVNIKFFYMTNISHAFTLEYSSERNRDTISDETGTAHVITSPFFPAFYPRDLNSYEHVLTCKSEDCRIHVLFSDFQLSASSTIEFFDWNGKLLDYTSGAISRPAPILSTGSAMVIRFSALGGTGLGYKATVKFLTSEDAENPDLIPITNCGGSVENLGGAITMMRMVQNDTETKLYNCYWLVRPPNTFMHLKTHIMMRIDTFEYMAGTSELLIRQGLTSDSPIIDRRISSSSNPSESKSLIVPLSTGFYVSLQGVFGIESRLAIAYVSFSNMNCFIGAEYLCQNHRCIPIQLQCDGFDHCGDKSDEPETCAQEWESEPIDRRWYAHQPNYYFPKIDRYPDLKTATAVFIMCTIGLLTLISCLIVLLYRTGERQREQRELQNQLQTISDLLDNTTTTTHRTEELIDDPPDYEHPPEYQEVFKMTCENEISQNRRVPRSNSGRKSRLQRPRRPSEIPVLEVDLPPESDDPVTTTSIEIIPTQILEAAKATSSAADDGVPESPPPEYAVQSSRNYVFTSTDRNTDNSGESDCSSSARSGSFVRGFYEGSLNVSLSLSMSPPQSNESLSPPKCHLWSETSRNNKPWVVFRSNESTPATLSSSQISYNSEKVKELGAYLLTHGSIPENCSSILEAASESSSSSLESRFSIIDFCSSSGLSDVISTKSCACCVTEQKRVICQPCLIRMFAQRMCNSCGGRITHSMEVKLDESIQQSDDNEDQVKLCNCFPLQKVEGFGKSCSSDQLLERAVENLDFENVSRSHTEIGEQESACVSIDQQQGI